VDCQAYVYGKTGLTAAILLLKLDWQPLWFKKQYHSICHFIDFLVYYADIPAKDFNFGGVFSAFWNVFRTGKMMLQTMPTAWGASVSVEDDLTRLRKGDRAVSDTPIPLSAAPVA
jgi:hypothetical protein